MLTKNADFKRVVTGKIFPVYTRIFSVSRGPPIITFKKHKSEKGFTNILYESNVKNDCSDCQL